jgi:hypothetical protein
VCKGLFPDEIGRSPRVNEVRVRDPSERCATISRHMRATTGQNGELYYCIRAMCVGRNRGGQAERRPHLQVYQR